MTFKIQSVVFDKNYWGEIGARSWLKRHEYISKGKMKVCIDRTSRIEYLKFIQCKRSILDKSKNYFSMTINDGSIKLIMGTLLTN